MGENVLSPVETQRWTRIGVLSALALLLGYAETFVPIPIPGIKLGLANIAVLVALSEGDVSGAFCVSCIKVLATGLLFGSPLTMAYSAAGTFLAFAGMAPLSRLRSMHLVMVSVVGAVLHELGQLAIASVLLGTTAVWYTAPLLLIAGCVTGALCGTLASRISLDGNREGVPRSVPQTAETVPDDRRAVPQALAFVFVASVIVVFHLYDLVELGMATALSLVLCLTARVEAKTLVQTMRPMLAITIITFVAQLIATPQDALAETARAMLRLVCVASLCLAFMACVPTRELTAIVARLVSPLQRLGVHTQGFVLAFDVAIRLLPTIVELMDAGNVQLHDVPTLIPRAYEQLEKNAFETNRTTA